MTIGKENSYFGYLKSFEELNPGTFFEWKTKVSGGVVEQTLIIMDPDTICYFIDPKKGNPGRMIVGEEINRTHFPQVEKRSFIERLARKNTQFYWEPDSFIKTYEPSAPIQNFEKLLRWES